MFKLWKSGKQSGKAVRESLIGRIDLLFQNVNGPSDILILFDIIVNLFYSMHDGGMVSLSKGISDGAQRQVRHIPAQIHGNMSRLHDLRISL